jgi:hypothetical protein
MSKRYKVLSTAYWEPLRLLRRVIFSAVPTLLQHHPQELAQLINFILILSIVMIAFARPFDNSVPNALEMAGQLVLFMVLSLGERYFGSGSSVHGFQESTLLLVEVLIVFLVVTLLLAHVLLACIAFAQGPKSQSIAVVPITLTSKLQKAVIEPVTLHQGVLALTAASRFQKGLLPPL